MEFFKDRLLHTDWCHAVVNVPGVVLAVSFVRVCQPTLTCFLTFPNVFQVFACCAEDKLFLGFCKTTFVYLFPFHLRFFLWFSFSWGVEHSPCASASLATNINPWGWLMNREVFFTHPKSQCTAASSGWQEGRPMPFSGVIHDGTSGPWATPDEDLCLQVQAFLRKESVLAWWELPASHPADVNRWAIVVQCFSPSQNLLRTDSRRLHLGEVITEKPLCNKI